MKLPADAPQKHWWARRRLWLAIGFLTLLGFASPFLLHWHEDWQIDRELAATIAETDRVSPGWRTLDLRAKYWSTVDRDAATQLHTLGQLFGDKSYSPEYKDLPLPVGIEPKSYEHNDWIYRLRESLDDLPEANRLTDQQIMALTSEIRQHAKAYAATRALRNPPKRPADAAPIDEKAKHSGASYIAMRLLNDDILLHCEAGKLNDAFESLEALFTVMQLQADPSDSLTLLYRLGAIRIAFEQISRILAQGEPDAHRLAQLDTRVRKTLAVRTLHLDALARRAEQDGFFEYLKTAGTEEKQMFLKMLQDGWGNSPKPRERPWYLQWLPAERPLDARPLYTRELQHFNRYVAFAEQSRAAQLRGFDEFIRQEEKTFGRTRNATERKVVEGQFRSDMQLEVARAALALERYRQATGNWPATLQDLVPAYLDEVPTDVFANGPLQYRRLPQGAVVHSVGQDGVDNAGKLRRAPGENAVGFDGLDLGIRLWDPAHRRQPPLPPIVWQAP